MICPSKKCIAPLGSSSVPGTSWRREHPKRWNKSSRLQWTHRCSTAPGAVQVMAGKQWKDSGHTRSIYQTWWTNNASKINEWMINDLLYSYNIYIAILFYGSVSDCIKVWYGMLCQSRHPVFHCSVDRNLGTFSNMANLECSSWICYLCCLIYFNKHQ